MASEKAFKINRLFSSKKMYLSFEKYPSNVKLKLIFLLFIEKTNILFLPVLKQS